MFLTSSVWAERLTLPDTVGRILERAPAVEAGAAGVSSAQSAVRGATFSPPWETAFTVENFAGGRDAQGFDAAEVTVEFGTTLESSIKRDARTQVAEASLGVAQADLTATRVERLETALLAYLDAWAAQERVAVLREVAQRGEEVVAYAQRRVESGRSSEAELATARSAAAQARLDLRSEEGRLLHAREALATLRGEPSSPEAVDWDGSLQALDRWMPAQPVVVISADAARQQAEAAVAAAKAQGITDWHVSAGVRRLQEMDTQALVFSVSRPWGSRGRATAAIEEADANLRRVKAMANATAQDILLQQQRYRAEVEVRRLELDALRESIMPESERALSVYRRGYALGRFSLMEIASAEHELLNARLRTVDARRSLAVAAVGYRLVAGTWLEGSNRD